MYRKLTITRTHGRLLPLAVAATLLGCSDGRPQRVPISGRVLIDGAPLEEAFVKFVPSDGRPAIGQTDVEGRFSLTCYEPNDGAIPGTHKVAVIGVTEISGTAIMWRAPKMYSNPNRSGIEITVNEPRDDVEIQLTWAGGKPYIEREGGGAE